MKHIAILIDSMHGGGAEMACLTLARALLARKIRVDLILLRFNGLRLSEIPEGVNLFVLDQQFQRKKKLRQCSIPLDQIQWIRLPSKFNIRGYVSALHSFVFALKISDSVRLKFRLRQFRWTTAFIQYRDAQHPDVIYANLNRSLTVSSLSRRVSSCNVPIIWAVRNHPVHNLNKTEILHFKHLIREASRVHAISRGGAREVAELVPKVADRTLAIYNIISPQVESLSGKQVEHRWLKMDKKAYFENHPKVILSAGRFVEQKNFPMLFRAFADIRSRIDVRLILLGDGPERNELRELARNLNIENSVSMPGFVKNPYAFMAHADLFVLSSSWEGLSNVLIEALACGCPVVSTDCESGPREILEGGRYGKLVPVDDSGTLAKTIANSLSEKREGALRLKCRAKEFSSDVLIQQYEDMFNSVMS